MQSFAPLASTTQSGVIQTVLAHTIFRNKSRDWPAYLATNLSGLSNTLGVPLELIAIEHRVGGRIIDGVVRSAETQEIFVIESQLTRSDDNHLARLFVYLTGTKARQVIWIAAGFRKDHIATLNWLNSLVGDPIRFYAVRYRIVRNDGSSPAIQFFLECAPG